MEIKKLNVRILYETYFSVLICLGVTLLERIKDVWFENGYLFIGRSHPIQTHV